MQTSQSARISMTLCDRHRPGIPSNADHRKRAVWDEEMLLLVRQTWEALCNEVDVGALPFGVPEGRSAAARIS